MEYRASKNPQFDYTVQEIQNQLNRIRNGRWAYLEPDGLFGPKTEIAVMAYQVSKGITPASGIVGDTTYGYLMNESYLVIQANPQYTIGPAPAPSTSGNYTPLPGEKAIDGTISILEGIDQVTGAIDPYSQGSIPYLIRGADTMIQKQIKSLNFTLAKIDVNKRGRIPQLANKLENAQKFVVKAQKFGIKVATQECFGNLNKKAAIAYLKDVISIIKESAVTKAFSSAANFFKKIKKALKPLYDFLNKVPGLKYLGAIEKIINGWWQLFHLNSEAALGLFLSALYDILESLLIDLATVVAVAMGLLAIIICAIVIIGVMIFDYFFMSDNAGESLVDQHTSLRTQNVIQEKVAPWIYNKVY
ncbi:MAG: peptidoglycan-binding protein [Bacteroidales bacterium]|nr:peptidoglycan-binding protein [Bacteroidales bacterium]